MKKSYYRDMCVYMHIFVCECAHMCLYMFVWLCECKENKPKESPSILVWVLRGYGASTEEEEAGKGRRRGKATKKIKQ